MIRGMIGKAKVGSASLRLCQEILGIGGAGTFAQFD